MIPPITLAEKLHCVARELAMRRRVYPRLVFQGKMKEEKADHETEVMQAIVEDYRKQLTSTVKQETLKWER
jgi:hypothetical protein